MAAAKDISMDVVIVAVLPERYSFNVKDKQKTSLQAFIGGQYVSILISTGFDKR